MKIVHVVTLVSDDGCFGGPTSVAIGHLEELAARGHDVELVSLWRGMSTSPERIGTVPLRSRPARALVPGRGFLGLMHPLLVKDLWRALEVVDVVHIHASRDLVSLTALAAAMLRRKPFLVQTHGMVQPRHTAVARIFDRVYVPLLRRARRYLVLTDGESRGLAEVTGAQGPPRVHLPNGVRPRSLMAARRSRRVLYLARLHPVKRPEAFVEMAALVHEQLPQVSFTMYGPDEGSLPTVQGLIADRGLEEVVSYGGALQHAAAVQAYTDAAVYVLPSATEVFPMTVVEALSTGTPVVCTDSCGIAEELADRGAALITDGSPEAMAKAVCAILSDEALSRSLVQAGRLAVEEAFSIHAVGDRLEQVYREVVDSAA
ncbi:glycosyltransferase [Streptomyces sp. NPDC003758]|uniref:D-inositol 3-phosphate glycosyltransferase n=1 Tax=Streptomyces cynarae TaxID=2981134 RepID=A0ABY6E3N3_9ACTN|nr:glycosyltransferase [Streptomyces cynarae]UXY21003.1 glycosyltransferase [Streptomyces cynarae]